ncbi:2777_t:CDS:1, partial [Dentiscutata heterogama]
ENETEYLLDKFNNSFIKNHQNRNKLPENEKKIVEKKQRDFILRCLESHVDKLSEIFAYWAAYYLEQGYGIEYTDDNEKQKDKKRSIELYKDAADRLHPDSTVRYAVHLMSNFNKIDEEEIKIKHRQDILHYLHIAADRGHSDAYFYLGDIFCYGKLGVNKEIGLGKAYLETAIGSGNEKANDKLIKFIKESHESHANLENENDDLKDEIEKLKNELEQILKE